MRTHRGSTRSGSVLASIILTLVAIAPAWAQQGRPTISAGGVLNAAGYREARIAAGSMIAIFGSNLASATKVATEVPLPTKMDDVTVEISDGFSNKKAAIWFVSEGQINAQLPFDLTSSTVSLRVRRSTGASNAMNVAIATAGPAFYTWSGTGKGDVAALHNQDWSFVNSGNPAKPEEYLILYATGLGPVTSPPSVGRPGGDNRQWGAINYTRQDISVTIGGEPAKKVFAGLAPGFVGLYQINIQVPKILQPGNHAIVVQAGAAQSPNGVWVAIGEGSASGGSKPEDVVKRALEAQVRGDVNGFLAECTMAGYSNDAIAGARKLLNTVRGHATFSNFEFTHRATGGDEGKTLSVVRAIISFTATTADGAHQITEGVLAFLKKVDGKWKIARIVPDDMLNQQIYEDSVAHSMSAFGLSSRYAGMALNLEQFNKAIDRLLGGTYLNGKKLARTVTFGVIGQIPVVGDAMANVNQVAEAGENGWEAIKETYNHGLTGVGLLKVVQVGVGVLQIVTEPIPGVDAQADALAATMDQLTHNVEITRDLCELKRVIRQIPDGQVHLHPYLFQYPAYLFRYPAGLEMDADPDPPRHSFGTPVARLRVTAPAALDKQVPLMIVGEIPFSGSSPAAALALKLGGQRRGSTVYIPVEVGFMAQSDASKGDVILDDYQRYRTDTSVSRVVSWDVTCRRGRQELAVQLRNGETTPSVIVWNEFMNKVRELEVVGVGEKGIEVAEKASVTGFHVIGKGPLLEERFYPDLTNRDKCLSMAIDNPELASLDRGTALTINGVKKGETALALLLIGSADPRADAPEVQKSVPVHVGSEPGEPGVLYHKKWTQVLAGKVWQADVDLTISSPDGTISTTQWPLTFTTIQGGTFTIEAVITNVKRVNGNTPDPLIIEGRFVNEGGFVEGSRFNTVITITPGVSPSGRVDFQLVAFEVDGNGNRTSLFTTTVFTVRIYIQ